MESTSPKDKKTPYVRQLNEAATEIWRLLKNPVSEDKIIQEITQQYNGDTTQIETDGHLFLLQYTKEGFIDERVE